MAKLHLTMVLVPCLLLLTQLHGLSAEHFFERFISSTARSSRIPLINSVVSKRGQFDHFALPPQRNISGPVRVMFSLGLIRIVNFDEVNMILTFVALERYNWLDMSFVYQDTDKSPIILPSSGLWMPDLKVVESLSPDMDFDRTVKPLVYGSGEIMYLPKVKHVVGCSRSRQEYTCRLSYSSWHYSAKQVQPDFYGRVPHDWDMSNAQEHPVWQVASHGAGKSVKIVAGNTDNFVTLRYTLNILKR